MTTPLYDPAAYPMRLLRPDAGSFRENGILGTKNDFVLDGGIKLCVTNDWRSDDIVIAFASDVWPYVVRSLDLLEEPGRVTWNGMLLLHVAMLPAGECRYYRAPKSRGAAIEIDNYVGIITGWLP